MKPIFNATEQVLHRATKNLDDGTAQIRRWWSKKYNSPPNNPLFENRSFSDLQQEMFEDLMYRRNELRDEIQSEGDQKGILLKQVNAINEALGDEIEHQDALYDHWEREVAAGRMPDLDMMPGDLHD